MGAQRFNNGRGGTMIRTFLAGIALIACVKSTEDTGEPTNPCDSSPDTTVETGSETGEIIPRPTWKNPGEAVDLDPDEAIVHVELEAAPFTYTVDGVEIQGWAYNGQVPGPTIRVPKGATLKVDITNAMDDPTTIHWHGAHVPWDMDGVVWMQEPISPGDTFRYEFTLDQDAGTLWYHPHFDTARQVDLGLYGVLIIEDPAEPKPDFEAIAVLDSHGEFEAENPDDMNHGLEGAFLNWTVNGLADPILNIEKGKTGRLRVINTSNTGYTQLQWPSMQQIASDQGLLSARMALEKQVLAPGDRADFEILANQAMALNLLPYSLNGGEAAGPSQRLASLEISEGSGLAEELAWAFTNLEPSIDPGTTDVRWTFTGDPRTGQWEMNGETFPDVTIPELSLHQDAIIEVRNMSATEHPFHLHGHAFEILSMNGDAPALIQIEDTINIPIRGTLRARLLANNPGDWMAHCHILTHAEGGMMTVLRIGDNE
jgi:FtsP/CotA-like multicopper oxidase with cupredoxin domain